MRQVGLTHEDVGVKVSTRAVLAELLPSLGVPPERFASTCVLVDKLDKLPPNEVKDALVTQAGMTADAADTLLTTLGIRDFPALREALGDDSPAVKELERLWELAKAYGYEDWLVLDLSVVRGLAYYTGIVFEGFDRSGELRAIFGGGRYDKLLGTFGGEELPAAGFGFGDAVIVELLKVKGLLPQVRSSAVTAVVFPFEEELRTEAMGVAGALRDAGVGADLVLENKKSKWLYKHAERIGAKYVVLIAPKEAAQGLARVKRLEDGEQTDVPMGEVAQWLKTQD